MHKLVILIEGPEVPENFDAHWPQFLHLAEQMPGLLREATSRVAHTLFGNPRYSLMHELFFDSLEALQTAMASPSGRQAGELLQQMTGGRLALWVGDHNEDDLANIRRFKQDKPQAGAGAG
jgi:uncharacterized protein (TIGR02118 family)